MEISKILTADILDIIFEGKNKSYGAYDLRKTYRRRLTLAITVTTFVVLLLMAGFIFGQNKGVDSLADINFPPETVLQDIKQPEEKIELPPVKPPETKIATINNTVPKIVPDDKVKPEEIPPEQTELEDVKIDNFTRDGLKDDGLTAPPVEDNGRGIIEAPKKADNADSIFLKVEIESSYPGGTPAWARFLNKNLASSYPEEAVENGIQGVVVIQFIVDREGNVSNVEAISGPQELREPAMKVIRKSGKWIPAQQNTMKVKSYKRQPIVFKLADE